MTENAAAACVTPAQYHNAGTVGEPLPCTEVKLQDVPDMKYTHLGAKVEKGEGHQWEEARRRTEEAAKEGKGYE